MGKKKENDASGFSDIEAIIGFNPVGDAATKAVLDEALKEVREEREVEAKGRVKEHIHKLIDLARQFNARKKEFQKEEKKFNKTAGKLMKQLRKMSSGEDPSDDDDEDSAEEGGNSDES